MRDLLEVLVVDVVVVVVQHHSQMSQQMVQTFDDAVSSHRVSYVHPSQQRSPKTMTKMKFSLSSLSLLSPSSLFVPVPHHV